MMGSRLQKRAAMRHLRALVRVMRQTRFVMRGTSRLGGNRMEVTEGAYLCLLAGSRCLSLCVLLKYRKWYEMTLCFAKLPSVSQLPSEVTIGARQVDNDGVVNIGDAQIIEQDATCSVEEEEERKNGGIRALGIELEDRKSQCRDLIGCPDPQTCKFPGKVAGRSGHRRHLWVCACCQTYPRVQFDAVRAEKHQPDEQDM